MSALQEQRHIFYDNELHIEAYNLSGIVQKFPLHFHDFYVIGFMEGGKRHLWCKNEEYEAEPGDVILFNPRDPHYCAPVHGEVLDYRAINVNVDVMNKAIEEITGQPYELQFHRPLLKQSEIALSIQELYDCIITHQPSMIREEAFYFLIEQLLEDMVPREVQVCEDAGIVQIRQYLEEHYAENISLDTLAKLIYCSRYQLLRLFTKELGVSPYRYLQSIRISASKKLLGSGMSVHEVALACGFSDQSHYTHYFKSFTGITPKQYQRIFPHLEGKKGDNL